MPALIETITDPAEFEKICNDYFYQGEVFLKTANGNFKIGFSGYSNNKVALKIPLLKNMPETCIILCRIPGETIYAQLRFLEKQEENLYLFTTVKMQIISATRSEPRRVAKKSKQLLFVTKVLSDSILERSIALEQRKTDLARQSILDQLENMFTFKKIYFINEGSSDDRMRFFYKRGQDYFVPDFSRIDTSSAVLHNYKENILAKDYYIQNRRNVVSEAACGIYYRNSIPFGYIQINHSSHLDSSVLPMIKNLSIELTKHITQAKVFKPLGENLLVSDLSNKGIGIVFRDRSFIRFFPEKSYVHFELILPDQVHIPMLTIVNNIAFLDNKIIKAGCEIVALDQGAAQVYSHFLETLNQ